MPAHRGTPKLRTRLRWIVGLVAAVAVVIAAVGFLPGTRVYEDSNHCFGRALGGLFLTEHGGHADDCTPRYDHAVERPAGGPGLVAYLIVLLVPGLLVYLRSRRLWAWLWTVWTLGASILWLTFGTFEMDLFARTVTLWPSTVVMVGLGVIFALLLVAMPLIAIFTRRSPKSPEAQVAR